MCTHLHADHVGWNTRLDNGRWIPTFPNARYIFSKTDYEYYLVQERAGKEPNRGSFRDSVLPVVEAYAFL
jgi:glyoxylase-like metal-dependent hydrolase (beta-lactamase superfamily II)